MSIVIEQVERHRNGVAGEGFHVVTFLDPNEGTPDRPLAMVGVVFETAGQVAVFDRALLGQGIIEFGRNSWRGDVYEAALREAVRQYDATSRERLDREYAALKYDAAVADDFWTNQVNYIS